MFAISTPKQRATLAWNILQTPHWKKETGRSGSTTATIVTQFPRVCPILKPFGKSLDRRRALRCLWTLLTKPSGMWIYTIWERRAISRTPALLFDSSQLRHVPSFLSVNHSISPDQFKNIRSTMTQRPLITTWSLPC